MEQEKKERRQHGFHPLQDIGQLFLSLYNSMKKGLRGVGVLCFFAEAEGMGANRGLSAASEESEKQKTDIAHGG